MFNFSPKFKFDEERDQYVAELNGVEFVCDELQDDYKKEAQKLWTSPVKTDKRKKRPPMVEWKKLP